MTLFAIIISVIEEQTILCDFVKKIVKTQCHVMSRRYREQRTNSNYLPPLEPFPDDEEIFQPFDQHRLRDSLRLKKVSLKNSLYIHTYALSFYNLKFNSKLQFRF